MNIQTVQKSIISALQATGNGVKNSALWAGHKFSTVIIPGLQKIASLTVSAASAALRFAKSGPIWPFAGAAVLLGLGTTCFALSQNEDEEESPISLASTAWKIAGITAFVGSAAALGLGITALVV